MKKYVMSEFYLKLFFGPTDPYGLLGEARENLNLEG